MSTRRQFLKSGAAAALLATGWQTKTVHADPEKPNFVLFIGDDISVSDFGCYGHPTIRTPNVDQLAAGGIRFTNMCLTTSSCSPTRTSLITGRYPHNTGAPELHMTDAPYLKDLPQFPHELRKAGYFTAQAGKWHFNGDVTHSFDQKYEGGVSGAVNWVKSLQERPKDKPFFMWFAAIDAHRDWDLAMTEGPHLPEDAVVPPYQVDGVGTRTDLAHYYDEVHRYDTNIGKVVDELEKQGVYENTVIIVMTDNGRPFPRDKTWLYDSGIKTPFVVHAPWKWKEPSVVSGLASTIDLAPTLLELAGVPVPASLQGVSLLPMLDNPDRTLRDFAFAERNWHGQRYHERMLRHGEFVYIRNQLPQYTGFNIIHYGKLFQSAYLELVEHQKRGQLNLAQCRVLDKPRHPEELYNVTTDPHQLNNLALEPDYAETLQLMRRVLDQWTEETGDTVPPVEDMTPDRNDRETWEPIWNSGRPQGGVVPGQSTQAWTINRRGPVRADDVEG
ncbi:MAG: sulfatase [candidate division KSB1 bacterium]|nr:sulfatase [candidate division KSB1 bacterium]